MERQGGFGTWRRYKVGQAQFTQWLKQTSEKLATRKERDANASNGVPEGASVSTESTSSRKKKKKGGKEKISFADVNVSSSDPSSVHWSQLETMATTVVENSDPGDIPEAPINILRDVVNLRKKSARFFHRLADDNKDESIKVKNASHEHIINILDRVLGKFEALKSRVHGTMKKPSGTVDVSDLNNMFQHLEVQDAEASEGDDDEQPSETEIPTASSSRKTKKTKNGVKKKKGRKAKTSRARSNGASSSRSQSGHNWVDEIQFANVATQLDMSDPFDYYMLVYCFFEDFNIIRNYICERWCDYFYDGSVPLNTLAVVTNAACEFFQNMEVDLLSVLGPRRRDQGRYEIMARMLFLDCGMEHIDYESLDGLDEEETNARIFDDEADWLALFTHSDIFDILVRLPPGKTGTLPPSSMKWPSDLYGATRPTDRREMVHRLVMEYMQEAATVKALKKNRFEDTIIPAETEPLLGFQRALESRRLPSSVVFSMQLYIDIRTIMEHKVGDAFEAMQQTARWVDRTMEAHKPDATGPRGSMLKYLNGWQRDNQHYMLEDITMVDKKHRFEIMRIDEPVPEFALHKIDPIWTGMLDFRAKLITNDLGDRFASCVPLIEAAAYLYSAAKAAAAKAGTTLPSWPDMEKFVDTYSQDSQFKLGLLQAPESAFTILNNWENMMAIHVDPDVSARSKAFAGRKLAQSIGIRTCFLRRYSWEEKEAHLSDPTTLFYCQDLVMHRLRIDQDKYESEANTERILAAAREREANGGRRVGQMLRAGGEDGGKPVLAPLKIDEEAEKELRRKAMLAQLSPLEVLKIVDESVTSLLEGVLSLDYFKLWDESVALLRAVDAEYSPEHRARLTDNVAEPDCFAAIPMIITRELKRRAIVDPGGAGILGVLVQSVKKYLEDNAPPT